MIRFFIFSGIALLIAAPAFVTGQIRQSSSYQIERDSLNIGGEYSTSTNYGIQDTVGEIATGRASSTNYQVQAGYHQFGESFITITSPADVVLDAISGLVGGTSTSSVTWTVETNNSAGYQLSIQADTDPALISSDDSFADYTPSTSNPDFAWSVDATTAEFGYSVESTDVVTKFKDNGSSCNTGSSNANDSCWYGFNTSDETIASKTSANTPGGTATRVELQAESGNNHILAPGSYNATLTVTAVAL